MHTDKKQTHPVANLLRQRISATADGSATVVVADEATLTLRRMLTQRFVAGEWSVELAGCDDARLADLQLSTKRASMWRD